MTKEEIGGLKFKEIYHLAMGSEYITSYECTNAPQGHVIMISKHVERDEAGFPTDKKATLYHLDGRAYKRKDTFMKKLETI